MEIVEGLIEEETSDVIVNAWNCNFIPWFLLLPQGVSKALKKKAGLKPFNEVMFKGPLLPGTAVLTSAGKMSSVYMIHSAGLNYLWMSNEKLIVKCIHNIFKVADPFNIESISIPILGSGTGGVKEDRAIEIIKDTINSIDTNIKTIRVVKYRSLNE